MSEKKPNNPPAFACAATAGLTQTGMTLRDYFAAKAMAQMMIDPIRKHYDGELIAEDAYKMADLMLIEREQDDDINTQTT